MAADVRTKTRRHAAWSHRCFGLLLCLSLLPAVAHASASGDLREAKRLYRKEDYRAAFLKFTGVVHGNAQANQVAEAYVYIGLIRAHNGQDPRPSFREAIAADPHVRWPGGPKTWRKEFRRLKRKARGGRRPHRRSHRRKPKPDDDDRDAAAVVAPVTAPAAPAREIPASAPAGGATASSPAQEAPAAAPDPTPPVPTLQTETSTGAWLTPASPEPPRGPRRCWDRTETWVVGGIGLGALVAGGTFMGLAYSDYRTAKAEGTNAVDTVRLSDRARGREVAGWIGLGTAGVAAALTTYWCVFSD